MNFFGCFIRAVIRSGNYDIANCMKMQRPNFESYLVTKNEHGFRNTSNSGTALSMTNVFWGFYYWPRDIIDWTL